MTPTEPDLEEFPAPDQDDGPGPPDEPPDPDDEKHRHRMTQTDDFVLFAERIAAGNYYYYQGAGRCDPLRSGYADCSGLVVASLRRVGIAIESTGSFALARMGHAADAGLSITEGRRTRGALCYIGTNEGQGGRPGIDPGHVAISRWDGTTVEARNRRAGIGIFDYDNRGWDWVGRNHWTSTTPTPPEPTPTPPPEEAEVMDIVAVTKAAAALNEQPFGWLDTATRRVWSLYGFVIAWDGVSDDATLRGDHDPQYMLVPGGAPLIGWDEVEFDREGHPFDTQGGKRRRICVYGSNGAQYYGTADA